MLFELNWDDKDAEINLDVYDQVGAGGAIAGAQRHSAKKIPLRVETPGVYYAHRHAAGLTKSERYTVLMHTKTGVALVRPRMSGEKDGMPARRLVRQGSWGSWGWCGALVRPALPRQFGVGSVAGGFPPPGGFRTSRAASPAGRIPTSGGYPQPGGFPATRRIPAAGRLPPAAGARSGAGRRTHGQRCRGGRRQCDPAGAITGRSCSRPHVATTAR